MAQDFTKILVKTDILGNITDKLSYSVFKGGQNITPYPYNAISQSPSSITFNLQIPSETTVLSRRVMWSGTNTLKIDFPAGSVPAGVIPINYGLTDSLAPFPNHQCCSTQSVTLNNNTVSMQTIDVLNMLLRFNDDRELMRLNGLCPNMYDTYGDYADAVGSNNNPLGDYRKVADNDLQPRGAFPLNWISGDANGTTPQPVSTGNAMTVYVNYTSTEPLLLPPFIWQNCETNNQGIYGIANINVLFNLMSAPTRVFRSANPYMEQATVTLFDVQNHKLFVEQITPHPTDLMPSRNVCPYMVYNVFKTQYNGIIPSAFDVLANGVYNLDMNDVGIRLSSSNIQFNQIPDKVTIFVRKTLSSMTSLDADFYLPIRSISIQFNNSSGILSSCSVWDLYRMSVASGSNQSFSEFLGVANVANPTDPSRGGKLVPTTGSILCLDFAKCIQIIDDYYAPGSLGTFQFQISVNVVNQFPPTSPNSLHNNWELVIVPVLSGLIAFERGTSSSYTGLLTRADVLDVSSQEAYSGSEYRRMVGAGFLDTLRSVSGKVEPKVKHVKELMDLGSMLKKRHEGSGVSGGGRSGGALSRSKMEQKLLN
jgi:hypothetical protein